MGKTRGDKDNIPDAIVRYHLRFQYRRKKGKDIKLNPGGTMVVVIFSIPTTKGNVREMIIVTASAGQ